MVPNALVGLGWTQIDKSDFAAAAKIFSTVLDKYADQPAANRARYGRAAARQQLKDFAGAIDDAQAFLKADPKSTERSDALYVLGLAQEGAEIRRRRQDLSLAVGRRSEVRRRRQGPV